MSEALKGFKVYTAPVRTPSQPARVREAFMAVLKNGGHDPSVIRFSAALVGEFRPAGVVIMHNPAAKQFALVPSNKRTATRILESTRKGKPLNRVISATAFIRELKLQPGIHMPAHVIDGVLIVDYAAAVAPEAHA